MILQLNGLINATFVKESKNRFLCLVKVEGEIIECYVPSSSRLQNFIRLQGRPVLLSENKKNGGRTRYSLFAVKFYNRYIVLNLNILNEIVEGMIIKGKIKKLKGFGIKREQTWEGYKSDLLLTSNSDTMLVEVKGIISSRKNVCFPTVYSDRAIQQLHKIKELLTKGNKVHYILASLSPIVSNIYINNSTNEKYVQALNDCLELGMDLTAFSIKFEENEIVFHRSIKIYL